MKYVSVPWLVAAASTLVLGVSSSDRVAGQDNATNAGSPVHVTVVVTNRRDDPVTTLNPRDFELRDDGAPQTIDRVERPTGAPGRAIAFLLDEYHIRADDGARVRDALTRFLDEDVRSDDEVIVIKPLDSLTSIRPAHDREEVRRAIAGFEGRKDDYTPRSAFETTYMGRDPDTVEGMRTQIVLSGLSALTSSLGKLPEARKDILLISEGLAARRRVRGAGALPDMAAVIRSADVFDVGMTTINPYDGSANAADLFASLHRASRLLDASYELTYRPARADDGRFHAIQVLVKGDGLQVRARNGYAAPVDEARRRLVLPDIASGALPASGRKYHKSSLITPWFGMSRGADGRTRVIVTWEPAPTDPRNRERPWMIAISATTARGDHLFSGNISPVSVIGSPAPYPELVTFDAPPGTIQIDMAIEGPDQKVLDTDVRDINVVDVASGKTVIMPPELLRTNTARQFAVVSRDPDAPPVVSREFTRAERILIRVPAYGPGESPATVTATLLGATSQTMRALPASPGPGDGVTQFDLLLAPFAPGDYTIALTATSPTGEANESLAFRIVD